MSCSVVGRQASRVCFTRANLYLSPTYFLSLQTMGTVSQQTCTGLIINFSTIRQFERLIYNNLYLYWCSTVCVRNHTVCSRCDGIRHLWSLQFYQNKIKLFWWFNVAFFQWEGILILSWLPPLSKQCWIYLSEYVLRIYHFLHVPELSIGQPSNFSSVRHLFTLFVDEACINCKIYLGK